MAEPDQIFQTVDTVQNELARQSYVADRPLALTVKLSNDLKKPILLEGEAGVGKPEPEAYLRALDALQSRPNETWMVGDNLEWEVAAPQKLGIFAIWRCPHGIGKLPGNATVAPDRVVTRLTELLH